VVTTEQEVLRGEVRRALEDVKDPHIPVSLERMGMLRDVSVDTDGHVSVELAIPCLACPGVSLLKDDIVRAVGGVRGTTGVTIDEGWHHEWHVNMIDAPAQQLMRSYGIQLTTEPGRAS
jgi:ATP-binding protein involved in chromosome partitioning